MRPLTNNYRAWVSPYYMNDNEAVIFNLHSNASTGRKTTLSDFNHLKQGAGFDVLEYLGERDSNKNFAVVTNGVKGHLIELQYDVNTNSLYYVYAKGRKVFSNSICDLTADRISFTNILLTNEELDNVCYNHVDELAIMILQACLYGYGFHYRAHADEAYRTCLIDEKEHYIKSLEVTTSIHLNVLASKENKELIKSLKAH